MTLPHVIRIFFAIDLPDPVKEKLGRFISALKKQSKTRKIRWTKPENLHITLQFLSEAEVGQIPLLVAHVRSRLKDAVKHSSLTLGPLHLFPNPYRPRVIVLEAGPQQELAQLSKLIGEGVQAANYETETRPFKGHLTLGRIKQPQDINLNFLSQSSVPEFETMEINEVVLFRSEPQPEGSQYSIIEKILLIENIEKKTG